MAFSFLSMVGDDDAAAGVTVADAASAVERLLDELADVQRHDFGAGRDERTRATASAARAVLDRVRAVSPKDDARLAYWHGKLRTHASEAFDQAAVEYLQVAVPFEIGIWT